MSTTSNAERHALIQDYRDSENIYDATLGEILLRQVNHLEDHKLKFQAHLITECLKSAIERFQDDWDVIDKVYEEKKGETMIAIAKAIGFMLLFVAVAAFVNWSSLVTVNVRQDLHQYAKSVRASNRTLQEKERLLDVIDALESRLRSGAELSIIKWKVYDDALRAMFEYGIDGDEVRLIERELEKVERELSQ